MGMREACNGNGTEAEDADGRRAAVGHQIVLHHHQHARNARRVPVCARSHVCGKSRVKCSKKPNQKMIACVHEQKNEGGTEFEG
jgi:hypothetical protein